MRDTNDPSLELLLQVIDQGFDHRSWHGPNLRGSIRGVSHVQAAWRPTPTRHSIWEHVLHAAYWKYVVRRLLLHEKRGSFSLRGSNWIAPRETTASAWRRDVRLLVETHQTMRMAIANASTARLQRRMPGKKFTCVFLISGVAAHDVYHAGQIQLLKRLQQRQP